MKYNISKEQIEAFSNNDVMSDDGLDDSANAFRFGNQRSSDNSVAHSEEEKKSSHKPNSVTRPKVIANDRFRIKKKIGQGRFGKIYNAHDN